MDLDIFIEGYDVPQHRQNRGRNLIKVKICERRVATYIIQTIICIWNRDQPEHVVNGIGYPPCDEKSQAPMGIRI